MNSCASGVRTSWVVRVALVVVLAFLTLLGPAVATAQAALQVAVLPPDATAVRPATAQLLGEFFRQEVTQDARLRLAPGASSACADPACAVAAGRARGADRVLWCHAGRDGGMYVLTVTATHVASGERLASARVTAESEEDLFIAVGSQVPDLMDALATAAPVRPDGDPAVDTPDADTGAPDRPPVDAGEADTDASGPSSVDAGDADTGAPDRPPVDAGRPGQPSVTHVPIESAPVGKSLAVDAQVRGDLGASELYVMFQVGESDRVRYTRLRPRGRTNEETTYSSEIPGSALTHAGLRYYLRITDAQGREVSRVPSAGWWRVATSADPNAPVVHADRPSSPPRSEGVAQADRPRTTSQDPVARLGAPEEARESRRWWWIGGAAAVAVGGLLTVLAGGGNGDSGDPPDPGPSALPPPPDHQ